jgi:hypothetical protein
VFNFKVNGIVAGAAFILSFLIGIVSGGTFLIVLLRALIFGAIFFVFAGGTNMLLASFLPELVGEDGGDQAETAGSMVDISVEDEDDEPAAGLGSSAMLDTPENEPGLDQDGGKEYTDAASDETVSETPQKDSGSEEPAEHLSDEPFEEAPTLESLGKAFLQVDGDGPDDEAADVQTPMSALPQSGERPVRTANAVAKLEKNFGTEKMASAISTLLKKE